jgi:beta-glucosidase
MYNFNSPVRHLLNLVFVGLVLASTSLSAQNRPVYTNPEATIEDRVEDLLSRMTMDEKIGQMTQLNVDLINLDRNNYAFLDHDKARELLRTHQIGSFLNGFAISSEEWFDFLYNLQRINLEESRLGIPILYGIDFIHGASYLKEASIFPHNINLSNTFDSQFAYQTGMVTSLEAAALGHNWNFAPVLDIGRDPRWPRFYETFGEDPLVASRMGAAYVRGLQEDGQAGPYRMAATAKHFLGYSTTVTGWDRSPALIPMQNLHEFHRPSFQSVIDAGVKSVMINSGEVNGVPVHASYELLTTLLREEMGFEGVTLTDWADIIKLTAYDRVGYQQQHYHRVARDEKEATKMAILAGIDMSMTPNSLNFLQYMKELVAEGHITEERIDASVRRILRMKFELGLFEQPLPSLDYRHLVGHADHKQMALQAARESIVLLENKNNVLPLNQKTGTILLVGYKANSRLALNGGWTMEWQGGSESHYPETMLTIFTAVQQAFPEASVVFVDSVGSEGSAARRFFNNIANRADIIFSVVGEMPYTEFVGDITDLNLNPSDVEVLRAVRSTGKTHGIILVQGRPRVIPADIAESAGVVLFAGLPGFEGGTAVAEILSGALNPSGRLGFTYPRYPSHFNTYDHKPTDRATALWHFGHGLSYTRFEYTGLQLSSANVTTDGDIMAEITVTNTGEVDGRHAVLWFLSQEVGRITRPVRKLAHFQKELIPAGGSHTFSFRISPDEVLWYPDENGNRILEKGRFFVTVGDLRAEFTLE